MHAIVFRCQNGLVGWTQLSLLTNNGDWECLNDQTVLARPSDTSTLVSFLTGMASHSVSLQGAVLQVIELDV